MAAQRRRTTRSKKTSSPRRAARKVSKPSPPKAAREKKRRPPSRPRKPVDVRDSLMKGAIGLFVIVDLVLVFFFIKQCARSPVETAPQIAQDVVQRPLQIEVLNGCGVPGIANDFTEYLRAQGFDVVKTDNYVEGGSVRFNITTTVVVDRRGAVKKANQIAKSLGLSKEKVLSEPNEAYLIDASVILGSDYQTVPAWQSMER